MSTELPTGKDAMSIEDICKNCNSNEQYHNDNKDVC